MRQVQNEIKTYVGNPCLDDQNLPVKHQEKNKLVHML